MFSPRARFLLLLAVVTGLGVTTLATPTRAAEITKLDTVEGVTEYRLANGLRVLLIPDQSQPKVTVNCTIFVGSRHEGYGETGMAHLLEHMLFKGAPKFPNVPKALRDHGASFNGTTWVDRTNYFETMPATEANLEFGIELEADRLVHSFVKREDLMSEFSVVRNEFEMGENNPEYILQQRMMATAFEWHNYGKSTIGNRTDIERVPIDSLRAFYKKYYRPDNAMLIVAGKFDPKKALELIGKFFGPLTNPTTPIPHTYTEEPAQDGERVVMLRRVGTVGATGAVYHVPAGSSPEFPAVEVLAQVLGMEPAGRLYKALVETKKATSVSVSANAWHDPGLLEILAKTDPGSTAAAQETMINTLENLAATPVTDEETARAKRQLLRDEERTLANSQRFALQLSEWAACGSWKLFFLNRDRLEKVTAADVNKAAQKYLIRSNRTVGVYIPTKAPNRATIAAAPDVAKMVAGYQGRIALTAGEAFNPTPENVEKRVQRGQLGEGVRYALLPKKTRGQTVNLSMNLHFGNPTSLKGQSAVADLMGPMLLRGTKTRTRQQIQDELDKLNATLSIQSDAGDLQVTVQTKRANLPAVLDLLGDVLRNPTFPAKEFDLLKRERFEALDKGRTDPQMLAFYTLAHRLSAYPPEDVRYVPTLAERITRLQAVTAEQVKALYESQASSTAGELAIVGDFEPDAARKLLDKHLKGWKSEVAYQRIERPAKPVPGGRETIVTPDKANAVYVAGQTMPLRDTDPAYPALVVGNYLFGQAPLASRLSNRVRGKEGLSYGVGSMVVASPIDKSGRMMLYAITNPKNMPKVESTISEELTTFLEKGASASETEEAKKAYLQSQKERRANDRVLASLLVETLHAGRTFAFYAEQEKKIDAVQPGDIKRAFDKFIDPKKLIIIEAGDLSGGKKTDKK